MSDSIEQTITAGNIRLFVIDGKLHIIPNKASPGAPVIVDLGKLERWASKLYRDEVLR